jgi:hypothetical protein
MSLERVRQEVGSNWTWELATPAAELQAMSAGEEVRCELERSILTATATIVESAIEQKSNVRSHAAAEMFMHRTAANLWQ